MHHSLHPKGTSCGAHIEQDFSHAFEMTAFSDFLRIYQKSLCRFGEYFSGQNSFLPPITIWQGRQHSYRMMIRFFLDFVS